MNGTRVIAILVVIILATAVAPPVAAWAVNRHRVARAAADVAAIAERLRSVDGGARSRRLGDVLLGPGRMPVTETPAASRWSTAPRATLAGALSAKEVLPIDPWGNCYLSNVEAGAREPPATVWVLSAGPNGMVDTPFLSSASNPAGDDVAVRIR